MEHNFENISKDDENVIKFFEVSIQNSTPSDSQIDDDYELESLLDDLLDTYDSIIHSHTSSDQIEHDDNNFFNILQNSSLLF